MPYTYKDYAADLNALVTQMADEEKQAQAENNEDNRVFLNEMRCIKALAPAWVELSKAESGMQLMSAGGKLADVYKTNKFSTSDYFPGVVGPRTVRLAENYLALLQKSLKLEVPQVGNFITQPAINLQIASEKKDTERCIKALEKLISTQKYSSMQQLKP